MNAYDLFWVTFLIIVITGIVKGCGENRTIVVFKDYDDLGLTFLVPASFFLIAYVFAMLGVNATVGSVCGGVVAFGLFIKLVGDTYHHNGNHVGKLLLALVTKIPLAIIWVFNLIQVLNPSGKGAQRSRNRGSALVILALLTPVIGLVVVEKKGSFFNPKSWLRGRRVGSAIRNSL